MACTISNNLCWRPVLEPNPNIPFEFYLELIAHPRIPPPTCPLQYPSLSNFAMRPKPPTFYPYNPMKSINMPMSLIREKLKGTGFPRTSTASTAEAEPKKHEENKNKKKYGCKHCGRCFTRSNTLVTHERIHTGEKPFQCDSCHRKFRQYGNLTRHKVIHTDIKPFSCPICKRSFNRKSNLKTHINIHRSTNIRSET